MNIKDRRDKVTKRDMTRRGDRINYLRSLRSKDRKHKTFKATMKV